MHDQRRQDGLVAAIVGWLAVLAILAGMVLPMAEDTGGIYGGVVKNTLAQGDTGNAAIMAILALVVAWRVYRTYTNREKPIWIIVPAAFIGINLALLWESALTLYPVLPDGSFDVSSPSTASAGIGLYIIALGTVLTITSGIALWKISGAPVVVPSSDRQARRGYEGPAAKAARIEADAWDCTLCGSRATGTTCRACGAAQVSA